MTTDAYERCAGSIRPLRFSWFQNPEAILNEQL